jgi:hypothetical protein
MEWLAASLLTIFLLWRFPKVTLKVAACLLLLGAVAGAGLAGYSYLDTQAHNAEKAKITVAITADNHCSPSWPLYIRITNGTAAPLDSVSFSVSAKVPGRSSEVYSDFITSDIIIPPSKTATTCYGLASYKVDDGKIAGRIPSELAWEGRVTYFTKSK